MRTGFSHRLLDLSCKLGSVQLFCDLGQEMLGRQVAVDQVLRLHGSGCERDCDLRVGQARKEVAIRAAEVWAEAENQVSVLKVGLVTFASKNMTFPYSMNVQQSLVDAALAEDRRPSWPAGSLTRLATSSRIP